MAKKTGLGGRTEFTLGLVFGPKGQEKHSPGFTLGNCPHPNCPEGATRYVDNRVQTFEPDRRRISGPFRAKRLSGLTQGKPWAKLSCPYGAGPSGCMTGAKHIPLPCRGFETSFGATFTGSFFVQVKAGCLDTDVQLKGLETQAVG